MMKVIRVDWNGGGDFCGTARAEAPGLSAAREKAGAVPAKRVRRNGNQRHRRKRAPWNENSFQGALIYS